MAILITGAMGHVGYAVAREAARIGERVIAQYRETYRENDASALGKGVTWVRCDLADRGAVDRLFEGNPIDACIHLAAVSSEAYARPNPAIAVEANVEATASLLEMTRRRTLRRFITVSTGSVFQETDGVTPIDETAMPSPRSIYATTKRCAELLTSMYRTQFQLPAAIIRISWVYGPTVVSNSPTRGPIPAFLIGALKGIARRDASGGDFAASFTYVDDVASGLLAACQAPRLDHDIYHLGPGVNFSARDVAAAIQAAVPKSVIELGSGTEPWTAYAALRGPLSGNRLQRDTGFAVHHSLGTGIAAYAEWMRAHPETWR